MNSYIKKIHVNKLFHLNDFDIELGNENSPHLIITGKNGSGKTVLLNAIADFLEKVKVDKGLYFLHYKERWKTRLDRIIHFRKGTKEYIHEENRLKENQQRIDDLFGKVEIDFGGNYEFIPQYDKGDFIIAFYQAARKTVINEVTNPKKPNLKKKGNVKDVLVSQFLYFLSDLKIQEALARNEGQIEDADNIKMWFNSFENLLREIYEDENLHVKFNYKDYSFRIETTGGKSFKFTQLSDGFAAILEIVADLILKMQDGSNLVRSYQMGGIVMIDEIETHLHLALQKMILPFLTKLFPNVQFIVTTHSPFVLSSLPNAVAFDLEHKEIISDLTEYSYQSLAEGYFGVSSESHYAKNRFNELKAILEKEQLSASDKAVANQILNDFEKIPEAMSPSLVRAYNNLLISSSDKIESIKRND